MTSSDHQLTANPPAPEGWRLINVGGEYTLRNGPLYVKREGEALLMGLRIEQRHTNPRSVAHGGMLMTFADMMLPISSRVQAGLGDRFLPTISMSTDFLAPAPVGGWLVGRTRVLRVTRNLVFAEGMASVDDTPIIRANGIFKIGESLSAKSDDLGQFLSSL